MARISIVKADGTPTRMFWSDSRAQGQRLKRVYRETDDGRVQRAKTLRFDAERNKLKRV